MSLDATMLAQLVVNSYSVGQIAISVVILAAVIGLVLIACRQFGVAIPPWAAQVFWLVITAVVLIFAIRLVLSL